MNRLKDIFSTKLHVGRRRRHLRATPMRLESLEPRALLAVTLPPSINSDTVEIDDNVIVADGSWNITATGGLSADGHVQIFGNSRGRIDGTAGQSDEDLTINAATFITVTGAIGATNRIDDLTLLSTASQPVNLQQAVYLTGNLGVTNAGSFTVGSTVDVGGNLLIDSATNVMFAGNVNVDGNLIITNASSVIFAGTLRVGGQLTITNVTGATRFFGDVSVGAASITSTNLVQVQANFSSTGNAGDGDVTITSDQVSLSSGMLESSATSGSAPSATLTVKPRTTSRDLTIGSPPGIPSGVNITDADLFAIQPGWKRVVFGDEAAGTGAVRIGSIGSQYGGFSQILNTTTIVGGTVQVVQPVDVTDLAEYLELIARGTGSPGSGSVTINAAINQTADERNNWIRITSSGSVSLNAPIWSDQTVSLTTTANGTVTQGGSSAPITTVALSVDADGSVTLADSGNAVSTFAARTTNDSLVFREDSGYSISQITTVDSARDAQQIATVTGIDVGTATVRLVAISGQTAAAVGQGRPIIAGQLGLEGTDTDWSLDLSTNDVQTLAGNTGSIDFRDTDDLTIDTVAAVSPRASLSGITVARTLSVTAGTTLTITAAGDIASAATSGTAVSLTAPSGISTAGAIETSGANANVSNATTLTGDVVVDLENGPARGTILFMASVQGTSSGQESLTIGGNLDARGSIGSTTALELLSVSGTSLLAAGITLRTTGSQTYTGAASSTGTVTIQAGSGSTVTFLDTVTLGGLITAVTDTPAYHVTMTGSSVSVTNAVTFANTGTVTLGDASTDSLSFAGGLTSTAPSLTTLAGAIGTTNANATFGTTTLSANTTVATGTGNATFGGTVNGAQSLAVNSTGTTTFSSAVGGTSRLVSLTTNAGGTTAINGISIKTSGATGQIFNDAVTLGANTTLDAAADAITFAVTLDGPYSLNADTTGTTTFGGSVGGTTPLRSLSTNAGGTTRINGGGVSTTAVGGQVYNDAVQLGATTRLSASTGPVTLASTVNGASRLIVNTSGVTTFQGVVGGTTPLLSLVTDAAGSTRLQGGSITTSGPGGQIFNDPVVLGATTKLAAAAGPVTLATTVDGTYRLVVNTSGVTSFRGAVGDVTPLLSLATDAGGRTRIEGGSVVTNGQAGQVFGDPVTLGANATLSAGSRPITFANTLDGAYNLTANTNGITTFAGAVGYAASLASLTTDAGGSTRITAVTVKTSGNQVYNDPVTFEEPLAPQSVSISSIPEVLLAGSTVGLLQGLKAAGNSLRIEGNAVFGNQPGSPMIDVITDAIDPVEGLGGLVVTGGSLINSNLIISISLNLPSSFTTPSNPIVFQGGVTLGSDVTILGSSVWFQSTVTGSGKAFRVFAVPFAGTSSSVVFDGDVGTAQAPVGPLQALCVAGAVMINAAIYSTGPVQIAGMSIDGDADNAIRTPTGTVSLEASESIGATTPIAVQATSVNAETATGAIRLRGIGDLVVGDDGLISGDSISLDASGDIRVPGGRVIEAGQGVTSTKPINWGVNTTADSGPGSLRDVLTLINAVGDCTQGTDAVLNVDIAGTPAPVFTLTAPLPEIKAAVTFPGSGITLDGSRSVATGLVYGASASGSGLLGVTLRNFTGFGVQLVDAQNVVVDGVVVQSLNSPTSMGLFATGDLSGTSIVSSQFSGGLRGALLDGARNLAFGQIGRGNLLSNNLAAPSSPDFAGTGIRAQGNCQGTVVTGNTFTSNNYGFAFVNAQNLSLRQNTFNRNTVGIFIQGICTGSTQTNNTFGTGRNRNGVNVQRARNV